MMKCRVLMVAGLMMAGSAMLNLGLAMATPADVALAACSPLPSDKGQVVYTITIPSTGIYRVWSRIWVPSAGNDGLMMQIDQSVCGVVVGKGNAMPAGQFTWVDWTNGDQASKFNVSLTSGSHVVVVASASSRVGIDKLMFLSDAGCTPTGDGANCQTTATVTQIGDVVHPSVSPTPLVVSGAAKPTLVSGKVGADIQRNWLVGVFAITLVVGIVGGFIYWRYILALPKRK